jgi:C1A family cysteine protease
MKSVLSSALLLAAATAFKFNDVLDLINTVNEEVDFVSYVAKYGKLYKSMDEYLMRSEIFKSNVKFINEHNAEGHSYTLGINEFSDWTDEEYNKLLGYRPGKRNSEARIVKYIPYELPTTVDWVAAGGVTPVKNQGSCGSCWTFSTTGALEGANFVTSGTLLSFSEQQLIDCDT